MKGIILLLISMNIFAADITAVPFSFSLDVDQSKYNVSMDLTLVCRYEKFVISDSSQYKFTYKKVPLKVVIKNNSVTITNDAKIKHSVDGYFRSNKGCYSISNFIVTSKKYAVGWANQFSRPVELKIYKSTTPSKYGQFDAKELIDTVANKETKFNYKASGTQLRVMLEFGFELYNSMSTYARTSVLRYKETNRPYKLK